MARRNGRKLISCLFEQRYHLLLNVMICRINGIGHQCSVKRYICLAKWGQKCMLMKPISFFEKPFHAVSFICFTQAFLHDKSHEAAERCFINYLKPQLYIFIANYMCVSFKQTLDILSTPQNFSSGQAEIIFRARRLVTSALAHH